MAQKLTPLMQQYWDVKSAHPDKIILFRMGDFYEMFHRDAEQAAPVLGIALTSRNKKAQDETPMCGVPHHSAPAIINKLLAAGFKVAICDQLEDPKFAKGLVKRGVTRVLSPGMVFDPETLDASRAHYLAAWDESMVLALLDVSTGEGFFFRGVGDAKRAEFLESLRPVEWVCAPEQAELAGIGDVAKRLGATVSAQTSLDWRAASGEVIERQSSDAPVAVQRLIAYAVGQFTEANARSWVQNLAPFEERKLEGRMVLTASTLRHLEVFETYKGEKPGSLLHAIDRTKTSGGARLLRAWLQFPLIDRAAIERRQNSLARWLGTSGARKELRKNLQSVGDLPRRLGKISVPSRGPRDLTALADSLEASSAAMKQAARIDDSLLVAGELAPLLTAVDRVAERIRKVIVSEPPLYVRQGGAINRGVSAALDELIVLSTDSGRLILELEAREREQTGIGSLKIRYNNVFGYSIEITNTHRDRVPKDRYERKQTLANAERYTTPELSALEAKVLSAEERRLKLEEEEFAKLVQLVLEAASSLMGFAARVSEVDVLSALAELAEEQSYVRPSFMDSEFRLEGSRHPVVEQALSRPFVKNDVQLVSGHCLLLTGPNMAGKSTLMRQVAVVSVMAQIGSFVAADRAELPLLERVSTRIGASDFLAEGLSTFMVEMKETAEILASANERTLLILDEIGRGTATFDGLSLAQAILEHLLEKTQGYTLFATHYHELTKLEESPLGLDRLQNAHMAIHQKDGVITFLHRLLPGAAGESYGIHVARLAGLPQAITERAQEILAAIESPAAAAPAGALVHAAPIKPERKRGQAKPHPQLALAERWLDSQVDRQSTQVRQIADEIRQFDVNRSTPLEALGKIMKWSQELQ